MKMPSDPTNSIKNVFNKFASSVILIFGLLILTLISLTILRVDIPFLSAGRETITNDIDATFSIGILLGEDPFHLREVPEIHNPVLKAEDVTDADASLVADPFIIRGDGIWYMFFEVMNKQSGYGEIGYAVSRDAKTWEYKQIVLKEPFHLSYPHVFLYENNYYMIPESNAETSIRLYKSIDFPTVWQYEATLLEGLHFKDSSIFQHDGTWWMFSETDPIRDGTLRLYESSALTGPWKEHPMSPIIVGNDNIARSAGKVLFFQDNLFRVAQDDWPTYGNRVRIFQIDELTATEYSEHELCDLPEIDAKEIGLGNKIPAWRIDGFHQLDCHQLDEKEWICCIDGVTRRSSYSQWAVKIWIPFTKRIQ